MAQTVTIRPYEPADAPELYAAIHESMAEVDELALVEALERGVIAGAALDVFEKEPLPPDHPLLRMDNVLLAAHNANSSPAAWERVHRNTIRNLFDRLGIEFDEGPASIRCNRFFGC